MASNHSLKMVEAGRVSPFTNSATPLVEFTLPLTYFDIFWLKSFPAQQIFFYQLPRNESTHTFFNSTVLPKLKHSFSLTLAHFLPIAGNIIWPIDSVKPYVLYTPNDIVSLRVAESNSDFNYLLKNEMQEVVALHPYIPKLSVHDLKASIAATQITFFPSQGFSVGICVQHTLFDGKRATMFLKAWAHICKENSDMTTSLPLELTPVFDRTIINYPKEIDMLHLSSALKSSSDPNSKSLHPSGVRRNPLSRYISASTA